MAKTLSLNSSNTTWVTTFYGGALGRMYTFTSIVNGQRVVRTFVEEDFFAFLATKEATFIGPDDGKRPEFDN